MQSPDSFLVLRRWVESLQTQFPTGVPSPRYAAVFRLGRRRLRRLLEWSLHFYPSGPLDGGRPSTTSSPPFSRCTPVYPIRKLAEGQVLVRLYARQRPATAVKAQNAVCSPYWAARARTCPIICGTRSRTCEPETFPSIIAG